MKCYVCQQSTLSDKFKHYYKCGNITTKSKHYSELLAFNLGMNISELENVLKKLYIEKEYSIKDIMDYFSMSDLKSKTVYMILENFNISIRGIKRTSRTKSKYENTCVEKYGAKNVLSKDTEIYHKRNETVEKQYGVKNVYQLQFVKQKINEVMLKKYGVLRFTDIEKQKKTKLMWSKEFRAEYGEKLSKYQKKVWANLTDEEKYERCRNSGFNQYTGKMNKLETKVSEILTSNGIPFEFSYFLKGRQFDFIIAGELLLECQGDFWHANPKFYNENDIVNFPGNDKIEAKKVWDADLKKKEFAEKSGFNVIYIWENDIKTSDNPETVVIQAIADFLDQ